MLSMSMLPAEAVFALATPFGVDAIHRSLGGKALG